MHEQSDESEIPAAFYNRAFWFLFFPNNPIDSKERGGTGPKISAIVLITTH